MYDVIIIGAGIGGLICAAKLATRGRKVLVLEKIHHIGGTSHIFKRGDYYFPMGPLAFSFPDLILEILRDIGIKNQIKFTRSHFQLISDDFDIIYSQDWNKFKQELINQFPEERKGLHKFFDELTDLIKKTSQIHKWHPDFLIGKKRAIAKTHLIQDYQEIYDQIEEYSRIPSKKLLDKYITDKDLKKLLGTQGTYDPIMNMVHLAFMWNVMSFQGIWFPSCGIHGISDLLKEKIVREGGEIKLNTPVEQILIEDKKAVGVQTSDGTVIYADWIVANADYKKVFLDLIDPSDLSNSHLELVKNTEYTGSELCVYLGIEPEKVDLSKLRAEHVFYRAKTEKNDNLNFEDFANREIEICLWSDKSAMFAPKEMKSLVLRVNMPYSHFKKWRTGEKKRDQGYRPYKKKLAERLIDTVEMILPGLSSSIVKMEIATPLTYQDWGQRSQGSIAGWTRDLKKIQFKNKMLVETPIDHLVMVGIYAVLEPFLGGFPVSMYTGDLAADLILDIEKK